jgi:molybdenum ABC transporter molybdate-binding protein
MNRRALLFFIILAATFAVTARFYRNSTPKPGEHSITVYCAAGLKKPVDAIASRYREEFGVEVHLEYGGTGTLLGAIRVAKKGDLFIAADDGAIADARKGDSIREVVPLVRQHPIIAVRTGNPKGIHTAKDLLRDDVRVALANPDAASIGRSVRSALGGEWDRLAARATVMKTTVTEIAADLSIGAVDAAIIWDSTVLQFAGLAAVETPEFQTKVETASAAVLTASTQSPAALRFARYLAAPEKGGAIFKANGFEPIGGDHWAVNPEMILYSGGVNRLAVEKLLREFSEREGATVTTVFNGCGILCATMKTMGDSSNPKFPDAYYACDLCFVPPVAEQFPEAVLLTETEIGIVVKKGNPLGIHTLADLAKPDLKVGLCNAEQSTLGYMTRGMLQSSSLAEAVRKNVRVEVPTADLLITQMLAGALEAAIVYRVNAAPQAEHLDYLPIDHPGAKAVQPFSVRHDSPNRQLAGRLLAFLQAHRGSFEEAGFSWRGDAAPIKSNKIVVPDWLKPPAPAAAER